MTRRIPVALGLLAAASILGAPPSRSDRPAPPPTVSLGDGLVLGAPVRSGALALYPVYREAGASAPRVVTLDEAIAAGKVEIRELSDRALSFEKRAELDRALAVLDALAKAHGAFLATPHWELLALDAAAYEKRVAELAAGRQHNPRGQARQPQSRNQEQQQGQEANEPQQQRQSLSNNRGWPVPFDKQAVDALRASWAKLDLKQRAEVEAARTRAGELEQKVAALRPDRARVNALWFINRSGTPLFLMAGEVVVGGKQDRIVAANVIVPSDENGKDVQVFCVERGRWTYQTNRFTTLNACADPKVRLAAQSAKSQTEVWEQVGRANRGMNTENPTGTYRGNYVDPKAQEKVAALEKGLALPADPRLVGVIAAVGGRVIGGDVFGSPDLFARLWPKIKKSYVVAALAAPAEVAAKEAPAPAAVADYLKGLASSKQRKEEAKTAHYRLDSCENDEAVQNDMQSGEGFLHRNVVSKK